MTLRTVPPKRHRRGFTLVELMVAVSGGLFIAVAVFALASDASRFYKRESRAADATLGGMIGFERLRADIARAGFLATPNVRRDPRLCGDPVGDASWPAELKRMASLRIVPGGSPANATLAANGLTPDSLVLYGNYAGIDQLPVWNVANNGGTYSIYLQQMTGALGRLGYSTSTDQVALLQSIFGAGRALRIQDQAGEVQFGTIQSVVGGAQPQVILSLTPGLRFRQGTGNNCGLKGNVTGAVVNPVNIVRYDLRNLATQSSFGGANTGYAPLYGDTLTAPWDADRTELTRVELDTSGTPIQGTEELVAEYAVDFKLGVTTIKTILNGTDPELETHPAGTGAAQIAAYAGDVSTAGSPNVGPHRIRAVRLRLSVRAREPDRDANIDPSVVTSIAPGLYRIGLGAAGAAPFARVRTMQADVSLQNQMGVLW